MAFDSTVSTMAGQIGALGHPGSLDVRRAHAVGIMADPQKALDLLAVDRGPRPDADHDPAVCVAEDIAFEGANPFRRPTPAGPTAVRMRGRWCWSSTSPTATSSPTTVTATSVRGPDVVVSPAHPSSARS